MEDAAGAPHHVITVQGTGGWARYLQYYVDHPITAGDGDNIAYEIHVYDPASELDWMLTQPAATLPVIIGEYGPSAYSSYADTDALVELARSLGTPYLAWTFHPNCPPNLIEATEAGCGGGMDLVPTEWGQRVLDDLATPW